jgi:hypothetical protein
MSGRQIVAYGPWLPAQLLQALDEGRLMFFCGAGISMSREPWGLPGFGELTRLAYERCNQPMAGDKPVDAAARDAVCREQYDKALEILETRENYQGQMRREIANILTSMEGLEEPTQLAERLSRHRALLDLAEIRAAAGGKVKGYRLVTTNFDNRFQLAGLNLVVNEDGPRLRPPSHEGPSPLVHLHGRIGKDGSEHRDLVLTTRDFGNAYLRHSWAARFVVEMFREFTVLFIGYSLSDPVMRYLMDVFATESGESRQFRSAFALVPYQSGKSREREKQAKLWEAKRVTPVLYDADHDPDHPHRLLDDTLIAWAAERRLGLAGRLKVATDATTAEFQPGTDDADPFNLLASVVWALDTAQGEIARRFAEHEPSPDISWFGPIVNRLKRRSAGSGQSGDGRAGTIAKPSFLPSNPVAYALSRWACRHLATEALTEWTSTSPEPLFMEFRHAVEQKVSENDASIGEPFERFWRLVLRAEKRPSTIAHIWHRSAKCGLERSAAMLDELRPRLRGPMPSDRGWYSSLLGESETEPSTAKAVSDLGRFDVVHAGDFAFRANKLHETVVHKGSPPPAELLDAADALASVLVEWVELAAFADQPLGRGRSTRVRPHLIVQPDAERFKRDLDILIDLTMASFSGLAESRSQEAVAVAARWRLLGSRAGHTMFLRLWLWAAANFEVLDATEALDFLVKRPEILWGGEYEPEALRFLRLRAGQARPRVQVRLQAALMRRPPAAVLPQRTKGRDLRKHIADHRSLRLGKAALGGVALKGRTACIAAARVKEWRDLGVLDDVYEVGRPIRREEIAKYFGEPDPRALIGKPAAEIVTTIVRCGDRWDQAHLAESIVANEPGRAAEILHAMRVAGLGDAPPYSGVFWGLRSLADRNAETAHLLRPIAAALASDSVLAGLSLDGAAPWLKRIEVAFGPEASYSNDFWRLWDLLAAVDVEFVPRQDDQEPYNTALNTAGGSLADALIEDEGRLGGPAGRELSAHHRARFDQLVAESGAIGVHGRVRLVMQLQWLHAIDPGWTERNLLPRFAWNGPDRDETIRFWRTFAFHPRSGPTLLAKLAPSFLGALRRPRELGQVAHHSLCQVLGAISVEMPSMFRHDQTVDALHDVGVEGCAAVLEAFQQKLRAVGSTAANVWRERIGPWLKEHWPVNYELRSGRLACEAIEAALLTREAFPDAAALIEDKFSIEDVDDGRGWLFSLHHRTNDQDYDYLRCHTVDIGRLLTRALSKKSVDFAADDMRLIIDRLNQFSLGQTPEGWETLFSRYR